MTISMNADRPKFGSSGVHDPGGLEQREYDNHRGNDDGITVASRIPKTPEILNLLAAISPLDECLRENNVVVATATIGKISPSADLFSADNGSSSSTVDSPTSPQKPASNIKLQFIKTNLKLTLERKRRNHNINDKNSEPDSRTSSSSPPPSRDSCAKCDESGMDTEEDDGNSSQGEANFNFGVSNFCSKYGI